MEDENKEADEPEVFHLVDIEEFIENNEHLFVVFGIFGAVTAYLSNLSDNDQVPQYIADAGIVGAFMVLSIVLSVVVYRGHQRSGELGDRQIFQKVVFWFLNSALLLVLASIVGIAINFNVMSRRILVVVAILLPIIPTSYIALSIYRKGENLLNQGFPGSTRLEDKDSMLLATTAISLVPLLVINYIFTLQYAGLSILTNQSWSEIDASEMFIVGYTQMAFYLFMFVIFTLYAMAESEYKQE